MATGDDTLSSIVIVTMIIIEIITSMIIIMIIILIIIIDIIFIPTLDIEEGDIAMEEEETREKGRLKGIIQKTKSALVLPWTEEGQNYPGQKCPKHQLVLLNFIDVFVSLWLN